MKLRHVALASFLVLGVAGTAVAGKGGAALTAGGKTIAGPGTSKIAAGWTVTIIDGLTNDDICVTLANSGKGTIRLDMIPGGLVDVYVPAGTTRTYCTSVTHVNLVCFDQTSCTCSWRGDTR
jgi:hypothetical protein